MDIIFQFGVKLQKTFHTRYDYFSVNNCITKIGFAKYAVAGTVCLCHQNDEAQTLRRR